LKNGWAEMKNRKILSGVMGVYIFKFLGDSGDGITWCKVGYHGTLDPWQRVTGRSARGFLGVKMPTWAMYEQMHPDQLELLHWWPELNVVAEFTIHDKFDSLRKGEWYREEHVSQIVQFVKSGEMGIPKDRPPLVITVPARNPYELTDWMERRIDKARCQAIAKRRRDDFPPQPRVGTWDRPPREEEDDELQPRRRRNWYPRRTLNNEEAAWEEVIAAKHRRFAKEREELMRRL
jgi:hypothetical protein